MSGRAPGPLIALGAAVCAVAFTVDQPLILAAVAGGALALYLTAPGRCRATLVAAVVIGVGVALLNPFVQANGDLILLELPDIPIFDLQVTLEEVVRGVALGLRAFAVTIAIAAVLAHADPDRLLALAGRPLPRSALTASIGARLMPTLSRDARALSETARLRGVSMTSGRWTSRARAAGGLATPLVGSALERSLDVAEAMAVRGYGSGPRTRMPEPPGAPADRIVWIAVVPLALIAVAALAGRVGAFAFYPTLDPLGGAADLAAAAVALTACGIAAAGLRR